MLLVDGGVLCRVPVRQAKELGADVVVGVDAIKNSAYPVEKIPNMASMAMRVFDIIDTVNVPQRACLSRLSRATCCSNRRWRA